ncbi:hypothetical protein BsWGS_19960 [Bradybaena similaris]
MLSSFKQFKNSASIDDCHELITCIERTNFIFGTRRPLSLSFTQGHHKFIHTRSSQVQPHKVITSSSTQGYHKFIHTSSSTQGHHKFVHISSNLTSLSNICCHPHKQ